ncbi:MAG: HK97 gp10 family phage protein [Gemmatimonadota bacterium]|nr:HK97 gp10 family phage protein [Gemmatimonadota bacterium]
MSIEVKANLSGLARLAERMPSILDAAANAMAAEIYRKADKEVPVVTGELKKSGRVENSKAGKGEAKVVYGGEDAPYAVAVHDRPKGRGHQFLRKAAMERRKLLLAARDAARREIEKAASG